MKQKCGCFYWPVRRVQVYGLAGGDLMKLQEVAQQVQMTKRAIKYYEEKGDVYKRQP